MHSDLSTILRQLDLPIIFLSLLIFGILEVLFPYFSFKQRWSRRITINFALGITNAGITRIALAGLYTWAFTTSNTPALFRFLSPVSAGVLSFLLLDIYRYGWHIMMHLWPIGWKFHRVHHCELTMNISTAYRFHAIEVLVSNFPIVFLVWLFDIDLIPFLIYGSLFAAVEAFQHSNWALSPKVDKFLRYFIVTPEHHRVHHSQIVRETDSNYGSLLTIWDRLFGTFCYVRDTKKINIGLEEAPKPLKFTDLLTLPFRGFRAS
ncbi:MAG TPA: sterol desaturase family protein [Candidatus Sericytochromatia bacterium]